MCLRWIQDILENESINLDWMFRYSLINDIVKVRVSPTTETRHKTKCFLAWIYFFFNSIYLNAVRKVICYI